MHMLDREKQVLLQGAEGRQVIMGIDQITPDLVKRFWAEALEKFDASSVDKDDSTFMKAIGGFLDAIGILDKKDFLERFTTTIFKTIYRPFKIGDANSEYSLWEQMSVLVHELVHVEQYKADPFGFPFAYVANKSARAQYEAEAYSADLEMHYWMHGHLYDVKSRAANLQYYGLEQEHIDYAASYLESIGMTIENSDAAVNPVAAWAMDWLEAAEVTPAKI